MAKARSPSRDRAYEIWQSSGGKIQLKEIANQLGISDNLIRKWKNVDQWNSNAIGNVTNENVTNEANSNAVRNDRAPDGKFLPGNQASAGFGAPQGNNNGLGNNGGAPLGNQNKTIHGYYSKFIPVDEVEMLQEAPGAGKLEADLKFARYKLAKLLAAQRDKRMKGTSFGPDGPQEYKLQDDAYEGLIQRQIKLITEIEFKLHKMQMESKGEDEQDSVQIVDDISKGGEAG